MYKVFVNDKPIILTSSTIKEENYLVYFFKDIVIDEIVYRLRMGKIEGVYLFSSDLELDWELLKKSFTIIQAAGGLVLNQAQEVLFIYRGNKWDLPKGRIEAGEEKEATAIREVEEECGIKELTINCFLTTTYHVFFHQNEMRLKETFWYLMHTTYKGTPMPQTEEGITEAVFKNEQEALTLLKESYGNIILVYNSFKK